MPDKWQLQWLERGQRPIGEGWREGRASRHEGKVSWIRKTPKEDTTLVDELTDNMANVQIGTVYQTDSQGLAEAFQNMGLENGDEKAGGRRRRRRSTRRKRKRTQRKSVQRKRKNKTHTRRRR